MRPLRVWAGRSGLAAAGISLRLVKTRVLSRTGRPARVACSSSPLRARGSHTSSRKPWWLIVSNARERPCRYADPAVLRTSLKLSEKAEATFGAAGWVRFATSQALHTEPSWD